jgi:excisionase family DNA binding protein
MRMFMNAAEFAKLVGVNRATVIKWIRKGRITGALQLHKGGQWRIPLAAYQAFTTTRL